MTSNEGKKKKKKRLTHDFSICGGRSMLLFDQTPTHTTYTMSTRQAQLRNFSINYLSIVRLIDWTKLLKDQNSKGNLSWNNIPFLPYSIESWYKIVDNFDSLNLRWEPTVILSFPNEVTKRVTSEEGLI